MAITKEQWEQIEANLSGVFGFVELVCDGYKINAQVQQDKMKLVVSVYVDGIMKGEWIFNAANSEIPRKFHCEKKRPACGTIMRAWYLEQSKSRTWSKQERADYAAKAKETTSTWLPYWTSAKAFCRHIRKTCTSIEIVKIGH
ncbi:MAG: hypothetical protein AB1722_12370 [Pseudomonadota bacterium]